jgi:hypothetical protein
MRSLDIKCQNKRGSPIGRSLTKWKHPISSNKRQLLQSRCTLAVSIFIQHSILKPCPTQQSENKQRQIPEEMQLEVVLFKIGIACP